MLKVKNVTPFKPRKMKKGGNFYHGCTSVAFKLDFNQNFVLYPMQVILVH